MAGLTVGIDRQPTQSLRLEVELDGCTINTGTVILTAGSTVETLTFTQNEQQRTTKYFPVVDSIVLANISEGFVKVKGITNLGQPVNQIQTVVASMPVRFYTESGRIKMEKPGRIESAQFKVMAEPDANLLENDIIDVLYGAAGMTSGRIIWKEYLFDFNGLTHHIEAYIDCIN